MYPDAVVREALRPAAPSRPAGDSARFGRRRHREVISPSTTLHDLAEVADVRSRIPIHEQEVGALAGGDGSGVATVEHGGGVSRRRDDGVEGRQPRFDEQLHLPQKVASPGRGGDRERRPREPSGIALGDVELIARRGPARGAKTTRRSRRWARRTGSRSSVSTIMPMKPARRGLQGSGLGEGRDRKTAAGVRADIRRPRRGRLGGAGVDRDRQKGASRPVDLVGLGRDGDGGAASGVQDATAGSDDDRVR